MAQGRALLLFIIGLILGVVSAVMSVVTAAERPATPPRLSLFGAPGVSIAQGWVQQPDGDGRGGRSLFQGGGYGGAFGGAGASTAQPSAPSAADPAAVSPPVRSRNGLQGLDLSLSKGLGDIGTSRADATFNVFFDGASAALDTAAAEVVLVVAEFAAATNAREIVIIANPSQRGGDVRALAGVRAAAVALGLKRAKLPASVKVSTQTDTEGSYLPEPAQGPTAYVDARIEIQVFLAPVGGPSARR